MFADVGLSDQQGHLCFLEGSNEDEVLATQLTPQCSILHDTGLLVPLDGVTIHAEVSPHPSSTTTSCL